MHFSEKHKNRTNLGSGPRGNDRTRREAFDTPNESSVAALGASLVTKQAGGVTLAFPYGPKRGAPLIILKETVIFVV